jgi:hypothetical protein
VSRPAIDYLGVGFVSLGAAGLVLGLSWGGTQYPWDSATILGLFAGSLVALALFVFFESRAVDPILPLRLFRRQVFSLSVVLAFIVGFAMLGALTFLPTYFQYVRGASATASGIQTLPLVVGLLVTSVASGTLVGRTGRYKIFPVAGSLVMEVPLRDTAKAGAGDVGGGFGMPERAESLEQLELAIARLLRSGGPSAMAEIREESGTRLDVGDGWCVGAVYLRARLGRDADVTEIAHRYRLPGAVLRPAFEHARAAGYLTGDDDQLRLTETGQQEIDGLIAAMFAWLSRELRDWDIEDDQLLRDAMGNIARQIVEQDPFPAPTPELTAAAAR